MRGHVHHEELPFLVASYIEYIRKGEDKKTSSLPQQKKGYRNEGYVLYVNQSIPYKLRLPGFCPLVSSSLGKDHQIAGLAEREVFLLHCGLHHYGSPLDISAHLQG